MSQESELLRFERASRAVKNEWNGDGYSYTARTGLTTNKQTSSTHGWTLELILPTAKRYVNAQRQPTLPIAVLSRTKGRDVLFQRVIERQPNGKYHVHVEGVLNDRNGTHPNPIVKGTLTLQQKRELKTETRLVTRLLKTHVHT